MLFFVADDDEGRDDAGKAKPFQGKGLKEMKGEENREKKTKMK